MNNTQQQGGASWSSPVAVTKIVPDHTFIMKIRDKIRYVFGIYILLAAVFGFFAYKELGTISSRIKLVENVDDLNKTIFEVRRHEKNFLLYNDRGSYNDLQKHLSNLKISIDTIQTEIIHEIGGDNYARMKSDIVTYEHLISNIAEDIKAQTGADKDSLDKLRTTAREIESFGQSLSKRERTDIATVTKTAINLIVLALVVIVILGVTMNIKLATSIAAPIRTLEKITKKIAQGDFSEHMELKGQDELSSLELSFNLMEDKLKNALLSLEHSIEQLHDKQAQLVEAEKLASVGKLAAGVAHEINNPLTAVLTFSNLMLEQCTPDDPRHETLKLMARETDRARNIVRQLLNFGRETVIKSETININQPVSEIIDSLEAQDAFKGIKLDLRLDKNIPAVQADPAQIGQVVMNMLLNAIHAITPPGRIEVATRMNGDAVEIVFADTGAGIQEEHLHKIFDPFFTTKDAFKGTGLGLAVSYGIVKKHGGDIKVASVVGQGTTFTVRLPIHG